MLDRAATSQVRPGAAGGPNRSRRHHERSAAGEIIHLESRSSARALAARHHRRRQAVRLLVRNDRPLLLAADVASQKVAVATTLSSREQTDQVAATTIRFDPRLLRKAVCSQLAVKWLALHCECQSSSSRSASERASAASGSNNKVVDHVILGPNKVAGYLSSTTTK